MRLGKEAIYWRTPVIRLGNALACVLSMFIVSVGLPHAASANGYDVISCNTSLAGGANNAWHPATIDPGMTSYVDCPAGQGLDARDVYDGGASSWLQGAFVYFDAPSGNSIASVSFDGGLRRNDCGWGVEMVAGPQDWSGNVIFGLPANQLCDSQFQTPDEYTFFPNRFSYAVNAPRVRIETRCGASSCSRNGVASIHIRNVDVRVEDDAAPSLTGGRGALWTSAGWLSGRQTLGFDASDASGISASSISVDGRVLTQKSYACDFTLAAPCPAGLQDESLATDGFGTDGPHVVTLSATDAAGNTATASRTDYIDNTAPDAPQNIAVEGGDGWHQANGFNISWSLASSAANGAPIVGAGWELCPADVSQPCRDGRTDGANITALKDFRLPQPGAYNLRVWLVDAAGNADKRLSANPLTLRYDDATPSVSIDPPDPNDPTLISAPTTDLGSGVTSGQIQIRHHQGGNWLTLPTSVVDGKLVAHIDDEHLGDGMYDVQATATDAAGNQRTTTQRADGSTETITLPLRLKTELRSGVVVRHGRRANLARSAYARYGQLVRVRGRLVSPEGNPLQDVDVQAWTQIRDGVTPPRLIATVKTTRKGSFSFLVRKGPSRSIRIRYGGTSQIRSATKILSLNVRSATSIRPNHKSRVNGEVVRFHGRIKTGRIPKVGKLVVLEVWVRGRWHTFATTRAGQRGMWSFDYRFDGTNGNQDYRFRAMVPREAGYPFATGLSRITRVRVHGD